MRPRPQRASDPCRVRYGFWRLHLLALTAARPMHGAAIQRALREYGHPLVLGTLMPVLQQMVDAGLLERVPTAGLVKPLRTTPKGQQEIVALRPYLVLLADLIDGKPLQNRASAVAIVSESETATARLRAARQRKQDAVDDRSPQSAQGERPRQNVFSMTGRIRALLATGMTVAEITALLGCKADLVYKTRHFNKKLEASRSTVRPLRFDVGPEEPEARPVSVPDHMTVILVMARELDAECDRLRSALLEIEAVVAAALTDS